MCAFAVCTPFRMINLCLLTFFVNRICLSGNRAGFTSRAVDKMRGPGSSKNEICIDLHKIVEWLWNGNQKKTYPLSLCAYWTERTLRDPENHERTHDVPRFQGPPMQAAFESVRGLVVCSWIFYCTRIFGFSTC